MDFIIGIVWSDIHLAKKIKVQRMERKALFLFGNQRRRRVVVVVPLPQK